MKNLKLISAAFNWRVQVNGLKKAILGICVPLLWVCLMAIAYTQEAQGGNVILGTCTLTGLSNTCGTGSTAGVAKFWAIPKDDITDVTFDGTGRVDSVTLAAGKIWYKYEFEDDTAFFNQALTINKSNVFIKHTLQWENAKMDTTKRNELMNLIECSLCGLVVIVKDNNGVFWFSGIKYDSESETWSFKALKAISSEGAQTGANPESDENKFVHILEGRNGEYAREWTLGEAGIDVTY